MYILKVFVFLLAAGGADPELVKTLQRPDGFATKEECVGFMDTAPGKAEQDKVLDYIAEHMVGKKYEVAYGCEVEDAADHDERHNDQPKTSDRSHNDHPKGDDGKI